MLRHYLIFIMMFTCAVKSTAQVNLVRNPSLEQYSTCPDNIDGITYANYWMSLDSNWSAPDWANVPYGVPEYCNVCAISTSEYGVPGGSHIGTGTYFHYPHTGNAMALIQMFYDETVTGTLQLRDYMQGHLVTNLLPGQSYCVRFYVTLAQASSYAINHIGAYLDDGNIDTTHNYALPQNQYTPQVLTTTIINDTSHWVKVEGSFVATGSERLITIGNFSDKAHTGCLAIVDTTGFYLGVGGVTWYLVDDISVIRSDANAIGGPDVVMPTTGDSVIIGDTLDTYLPTYWYVNGVKIDSNKAWIKVHPDTTTKYVVALLQCGGEMSYDTVVVWSSATIDRLQFVKYSNVIIHPNPITNNLIIENASGALFVIYDVFGKEVFSTNVSSNNELIYTEKLSSGIYIGQVIDPLTGQRKSLKLIKE